MPTHHCAPPTTRDHSRYAKVLSGWCFGRIWRKLLQTPVSSVAFPGQCRALHDVLQHYSDESKPSIMYGVKDRLTGVDI